ncbi:D-beta-hydroxybutyrate dehydrogenase [Nymphon striatum]|nr:D-beta-hydroxybutyrate dehydrogenase [Nymphon striatum]
MKRCAIVTGGASGIGKACVERLIGDGYDVVIADLNEDTGMQLAADLGCHFTRTDLSSRESCKNLVDETIATFGRVDVLVNNGGYQHISPIEDFPEDTWDEMIHILLTASFLLTRYVWPSMKENKWGRVINIASVHSEIASPYKSAYISAKHGVIGLTRTAALEGGEHGITVNAISPAYVRTPLVENQIADQAATRNISQEEVIEKVMLEPAAIKRLIEPSEVANIVSLMCSDKGASITGSNMKIDCGWTAK